MFLPQMLKVDLFPKSEKTEWGFWEPLAVTAVHVEPRFTPLYIYIYMFVFFLTVKVFYSD